MEVTLTSSPSQPTQIGLASPSTVLMLPASISVPAGSEIVKFAIPVSNVTQMTSATVVASLNGSSAQTTTIVVPSSWGSLDIRAVWTQASFTKGPSSIVLYLTAAAPVRGITVTLSSSNPTAFQLPASVVIPAGVSQYNVPVTVGAVGAPTSITVQAKVIQTITRTTTIVPG